MKKLTLIITIAIDIILLSLILFVLFFVKPKYEASLEPTLEPHAATEITHEIKPAPDTPIPSPNPQYRIEDDAVRKAVEQYLEKSESEFSDEDYETLSKLEYFTVYDFAQTLNDIPKLFPSLKYLCVSFDEPMAQSDCDILAGIKNLKALDLYTPVLPSFDFLKKLLYVNIQYDEASYISSNNQLASASVLGGDFIKGELTGNIKNYVRLLDGDKTFELFTTDYLLPTDEEDIAYYEAKVFVSKADGQVPALLNTIDITKRYQYGDAVGGLHIMDVDFDGNNDILVKEGYWGYHSDVTYSCFLSRGDRYEYCPSFSNIPNVAVDEANNKVLEYWRNGISSGGWAMYEFIDGQFELTDCLTEDSAYAIDGKYVRSYTVEGKFDNHVYSTQDYTEEQIDTIFYNENSYWGISTERVTDKWNSLYWSGQIRYMPSIQEAFIDPTIKKISRGNDSQLPEHAVHDGERNTADIDNTKVMEAYWDFLYGRRTAFNWANTDHTEIKDTGYYVNDYYMYNQSYDTKGKRFDGIQYAFFDMNGDKIPELHIHNGGGADYTIFTYYHGEVVHWHFFSGYCNPQNDGSVLYHRGAGAPTGEQYQFYTLDYEGNETFHVDFEKYDWNDEGELNGGHDGIYDERDSYYYGNVKIPKRYWDYMTEKYLSIGEDLIVWENFGKDDE